MALSAELKKIKHIYGEEFMHICRTNFPTILEKEGMLLEILTKHFSNNARLLAKDIIVQDKVSTFKDFVFERYDIAIEKSKEGYTGEVGKPFEILKEAGYTLYEATTEKEIQSYRKYYAKDEMLCTFVGERLNRCICFWAIKDNALLLKRADFKEPQREDEYSTSVLAIQFDKFGRCTPSIKSRYNHTVENPDATYGNDLDKIAPGLAAAFRLLLDQRGYKLYTYDDRTFKLDNYVEHKGKFYRYNFRAFGAYYCPGNIVIEVGNDEIREIGDPEKKVLIDNYILDLQEKKISVVRAGTTRTEECFTDGFIGIQKIERLKDKVSGETTFKIYMKDNKEAIIVVDELNRIVEYKNYSICEIGNNFMNYNTTLRKIDIPNVKKIGYSFLAKNDIIDKIDIPCLEEAGVNFLRNNSKIKSVNLPNLKSVGTSFLADNDSLTRLELPSLEKVGINFLIVNTKLESFVAPKLREAGSTFLFGNQGLKELDLPSLEKVGENFLYTNTELEKVNLPKLKFVGNDFLFSNEMLKEIDLPELMSAGDNFLPTNKQIRKVELPELQSVGNFFMEENVVLETFRAPKLKKLGYGLLYKNDAFKKYRVDPKRINSIDIASLDKESEVSEEELSTVRRAIEWIRNTTRNIFNRNDRD